MPQLIAFNKPYGVICQFSPHPKWQSLKDFIPLPNVYPCGRLDADSEGLVLLTDTGWLQHLITSPKNKTWKTYWVQVEGEIDDEALVRLRSGVMIRGKKTLPAQVSRLNPPDSLWPRNPPIRYRKNVPDCWLQMRLREGRNRQVRRMTAAVGHPTLRLIRYSIGPISVAPLRPGEWRCIEIPQTWQTRRSPQHDNSRHHRRNHRSRRQIPHR